MKNINLACQALPLRHNKMFFSYCRYYDLNKEVFFKKLLWKIRKIHWKTQCNGVLFLERLWT